MEARVRLSSKWNTRIERCRKQVERIDSSFLFQFIIIVVILLSAILVGASTFSLPPKTQLLLRIANQAITIFFLFELVVHFLADKNKKQFFKSSWNVFDVIIVVGSLLPTLGSTILVARLLRIFRVLRLVAMIPELKILVNSLFKSIPRIGYIVLLMFVIFYIYGTVGSIFFHDINSMLWGDVSSSMLTLYRVAIFADLSVIMYETMAVYPLSWLYYVTFVFFIAFIFINMMVGTMLEVMSEESRNARALRYGEDLEGSDPATRAQIAKLETELAEIKALLKARI